ncbi:MAG: hypothetical protein RML93_06875 [Anaerolineales bacterium]|nr:hypothetical protein [Anaerolineales bacterium]MCS7247946.1 hypothetical protein [Anaerolineales bacterium]MDW8161756.1 hypothetical protein [Anaerolineales bacterium]MDW8446995.1 hypothetical protein [Anaerolineales bacterium]
MKKTALMLVLLSLVSITWLTAFEPSPRAQVTIVNKSGVKLGIQLIDPQDKDNLYFLTIEKGNREQPREKTFELKPATYSMIVYYMETWDPVYGFPTCGGLVLKSRLWARGKQRVVFTRCGVIPVNPGEPKMMKFWLYTPFFYPYRFVY